LPTLTRLEDRTVPTLAAMVQEGAFSVIIHDGDPGDMNPLPNQVSFNLTNVPGFAAVNVGLALTNAPGDSSGALLALSYGALSSGTAGGTVAISASATGFTSPASTANPLTMNSQLGGTILGSSSVTGQQWADINNALFGTMAVGLNAFTPGPQGPFSSAPFADSRFVSFNRGSGPFSVTETATVTLASDSQSTGSLQSTIPAPPPLPPLPPPPPSKAFVLASTPPFDPSALVPRFTVRTGGAGPSLVAVGPDAGYAPVVRVFDYTTGVERFRILAYDQNFLGGVTVATADVTGDGIPDIITGAGPGGGPHIKVFDGSTGALVYSFMAFAPSFSGGVFVAAGDVNGDSHADIIVGAGPGGGPHVKVFSGANLSLLHSFMAYNMAFPGGVRVAAGDVTGDGRADVITGAGPGGGPTVEAFDGVTGQLVRSFMAYAPSFSGGVFVAAGDVDGDGRADIITGPGAGGGPHVEVFDGATLAVVRSFYAYDPAFTGGVTVGASYVDGDGLVDLVLGPQLGPAHVRIVDGMTLAELDGFYAFDPRINSGANVA
jgi:hypothetical protein